MYGNSSPIFDMPEFPPLRRVKPLPKRRRTSVSTFNNFGDISSFDNLIVPDMTPDELANTFSSSMALQSYYMPIFNGVQDIFKQDHNTLNNISMDLVTGLKVSDINIGQDDIDQGEGDYIDHLQQPGNTKKRKVPLANSASHVDDSQSTGSGPDEELLGRNVFSGLRPEDSVIVPVPSVPPPGSYFQRRRKLTPAMHAGLQHKELLKSRKRQLALVLGSFSHTDSFALDQALSSTNPFARLNIESDGKGVDGLPIRVSRRCNRRLARSAKLLSTPGSGRFPVCDFTCEWPSATSERMIATRNEVALLQNRFEAELSRQASKTAEVARQAALAVNQMHISKRGDRMRMRTTALNAEQNSEQSPGFFNPTDSNIKTKNKKKKRNMLANASNPHHLRNYIPSRFPHSNQGNAGNALLNSQNYVNPPPLRFLSAEIPLRRKKQPLLAPGAQLTHPEDEWICAFCEYNLFYGDELSLRRSVRSRKKILSRRRRAMERAAAAANGKRPVAPVEKTESIVAEDSVSFDNRSEVFPPPRPNRPNDREKDRERRDMSV